jgi:hypothetical protein
VCEWNSVCQNFVIRTRAFLKSRASSRLRLNLDALESPMESTHMLSAQNGRNSDLSKMQSGESRPQKIRSPSTTKTTQDRVDSPTLIPTPKEGTRMMHHTSGRKVPVDNVSERLPRSQNDDDKKKVTMYD